MIGETRVQQANEAGPVFPMQASACCRKPTALDSRHLCPRLFGYIAVYFGNVIINNWTEDIREGLLGKGYKFFGYIKPHAYDL